MLQDTLLSSSSDYLYFNELKPINYLIMNITKNKMTHILLGLRVVAIAEAQTTTNMIQDTYKWLKEVRDRAVRYYVH